MRSITLIPLIVWSLINPVLGIKERCAAQTPTNDIAAIRQHYAAINRDLTRYRKIKRELDGYSAEGGELVAYFDGDQIMKIIATFLGESGRAAEEYYFHDGQLIFVLRKDSNYDKPLSGRVVSVRVDRFYFSNGRMVRWIDGKGRAVAATAGFLEKQKEYLNSSREFSDVARSQ